MMNRNNENRTVTIARQVIAAIAALFLLSLFLSVRGAVAEDLSAFDMDNWNGESVILEDPKYFMGVEDDDIPVISSVGKTNVKIHGVQSKYKLVNYTIPEQLLRADPDFLALMVEAEKYIGYPYVYGASNPDTGFDCSGFVCWVFNQSGVCDVGRVGANGLYSLCSDVSKEDARPGDLVFFEKTMGADVKGITHVGIYVGNDMMIHAGDPVGFADLKSEKWSKRLYGFGRLPLEGGTMTEKKKKRYPADRQKLHALLDRREQELIELQAEVEDLRGLVKQADRTAIHATAELYNVTPEQLAEIMKSMFGDRLVPELPKDVQVAPAEADAPVTLPDGEVMDDDDDV